jgi:L-2-hydroxyglutarate oxidase LhgO
MNYDIIIIGAGLVGLATAYQTKLKNPDSKILILEKKRMLHCTSRDTIAESSIADLL